MYLQKGCYTFTVSFGYKITNYCTTNYYKIVIKVHMQFT